MLSDSPVLTFVTFVQKERGHFILFIHSEVQSASQIYSQFSFIFPIKYERKAIPLIAGQISFQLRFANRKTTCG